MTLVARRYHSKKIRDIGKYRRLGHVLIGESNVAIVPAIGGYGVEDIYLGEFSPQLVGAKPDTATTTHAYTTGSKLTRSRGIASS